MTFLNPPVVHSLFGSKGCLSIASVKEICSSLKGGTMSSSSSGGARLRSHPLRAWLISRPMFQVSTALAFVYLARTDGNQGPMTSQILSSRM